MPEASTGGQGGRDNTRSPGGPIVPQLHTTVNPPVPTLRVAPGYTRIDLLGSGVTFTTSRGTITDQVMEMRFEFDRTTYVCYSGRSWTVPSTWDSGDIFRDGEITWNATRANGRDYDRYVQPRFETDRFAYNSGGYIPVAAEWNPGGCNCGMCQRDRAGVDPTRADRDYLRERQEYQEWERQELARREAREAAKAQSEVRAEAMLRRVLLPDELAHYDKTNQVIVTGADGQRYWIKDGLINNVYLLGDDDTVLATMCCHPDLRPDGGSARLPERDAHAAQILYLRYDLDDFYTTANISWQDPEALAKYLSRRTGRRLGWSGFRRPN